MEHASQTDNYIDKPQNLSKPKIIFVGTDIDFSQHSLSAVSREFSSFEPLRLRSYEDVTLYAEFNDQIAAVVFAQSYANHLIHSVSHIREICNSAQIVMAYSDISRASGLFNELILHHGPQVISFLPMNKPIDSWLAIIGLMLKGDTYVSTELMKPSYIRNAPMVTQDVPAVSRTLPCAPPETDAEVRHEAGPLTRREAEVLTLVATGQQNKTIANTLDVTEHTIKLHIHNLIRKLGVRNRTAAAAWYHSRAQNGSREMLWQTADG